MKPRKRLIKHREETITVYWCGGRRQDHMVDYPKDGTRDAGFIVNCLFGQRAEADLESPFGFRFVDSLCDELEKRGYDPKTLYFEIDRKKESK